MNPLNVLVVNDHRTENSTLSDLLQVAGHRVAVVDSCAAAIQSVTTNHFDIILCDLVLPDGEGCDLLPKLLKIRSLKAIAVMAYEREEDQARVKSAGFIDRITKPVSTDKLFKMLDELASKGEQFPFAANESAGN